MNLKNYKKGFTLIELLLVISIIGLLTSISITYIQSYKQKAQSAKVLQSLNSLKNIASIYSSGNNNKYTNVANQGNCPTGLGTAWGFADSSSDAISLIDQIRKNSAEGKEPYCAIGLNSWVISVMLYDGTIKTASIFETEKTYAASYMLLGYNQNGARGYTTTQEIDPDLSTTVTQNGDDFYINSGVLSSGNY